MRTAALLGAAALAGCEGPQSALNVAGTQAERIATLFWWMLGGAAAVWTLVVGLSIYAMHVRPGKHARRLARWLIVGGGALIPAAALAILLGFGLAMMPDLRSGAAADLDISVTGEQWWWRVRYHTANGPVELANEIRLPAGRRTTFRLTSADVIHSFWIPSLGGKLDMIPGRETRLTMEPTRTGRFRGACAEYCGSSHALMAFPVVVMEAAAFARWLENQAAAAEPPADAAPARGQRAFLSNGCGACHTVRGTAADGRIGPDLTHVGSRLTLGAGLIGNDRESFIRWIRDTAALKPGVHMPAFDMLPPEEIAAIAAYLEALR